MPPAIIAAVIAVGASVAGAVGVISMTAAVVIGALATVAGSLLSKTSVPSIGNYSSQSERKQVLRSSAGACSYVYGRVTTSGLLQFAQEQPGEQEADDHEWVHLVIVLAAHEIDSVETVYLGEEIINAYGEFATWRLYNNPQTVPQYLLDRCNQWKPDMIGKGLAYIVVSLKFDQDKFPSGIPNIKATIRGKRVYDPRDGVTKWTDNAALVIRDFYLSPMLGVEAEDIDDPMFIEAANISDQPVLNADSSISKRYTINGQFEADEAISSILDDMHETCAGEPTYMAGKHGLLVGAYYGPATMVLNDDMIISDIEITPETAYNQKVNIVTGTFVDKEQDYTEADFPPVRIEAWVEEDGNEFTQDKKYRFVTDEWHAQRLAQITLNRSRLGRTIKLTANYFGYAMRPGYYVKLTIKTLGIINQEFRITSWELNGVNGVGLTLRQETVAVWDDAIGKPLIRPDLTVLPNRQVTPPWNLQYQVMEIGEVVQGALTWNNTSDIVYNNVIVRQAGFIVYTVQVPGTVCRLNGLPRGDYTVGVLAVNARGQRSVETTIDIVIRAPSKPTGAEIEQGYFAVTIKPRSADLSNVSVTYDFWTSGESRLPNAATATVEAGANHEGQGTIWTKSGLKNSHTYWWYIRAVNAFGASDFLELEVLCHTDIADLLPMIDAEFQTTTAYQNLMKPIEMNYLAILEAARSTGATVDHQWSNYGEVRADIITVKTTIANDQLAMADLETNVIAQGRYIDELTGRANDLTASVQQKMTSIVTSEGTAKASYTLNLGINRGGKYYSAGMAMSIEPDGTGSYKSTTLFKADRFGIYNSTTPGNYKLVFAIVSGQTFIDDAMIRNASIDTAKIKYAAITSALIAQQIQSDNWNGSNVGWMINKNGNANFANVTVRGSIYANYGDLNNVIIRENCTILGTLSAGNIRGNFCDLKVVTINYGNAIEDWGTDYNYTLYSDPDVERTLLVTAPMSASGYTDSVGNGQNRLGSHSRVEVFVNGVSIGMNQATQSGDGSTSRTLTCSANLARNTNHSITVRVFISHTGRAGISPISLMVTSRYNSKWS